MKEGKAKGTRPKEHEDAEKRGKEPADAPQEGSKFVGIPERDLKRNLGCG